jgi:hypothetical protein
MSHYNYFFVRSVEVVLVFAVVIFFTGLISCDRFIPCSAVLYFYSYLIVESVLLLEFLINYF